MMDDKRRFSLSPAASFRVANADSVEVAVGDARMILPIDRVQLLLHLAEGATIGEVRERLMGDGAGDALATIVGDLVKRGLLVETRAEGSARPSSPSLFDVLNARYRTDAARDAIGAELVRGGCVVLRDAFEKDFAERTYAALEGIRDWSSQEEYAQSHFGYERHILDEHRAPDALVECTRVFAHPATRETMARLSRRNCSGTTACAATLYVSGDYSLPHSDAWGLRNVTFIWHLTKDWDARWGGNFYWVPSMTTLDSSFNTLVLFNVTQDSVHFVTQVSPHARGKRFTVNGWWHAENERSLGWSEPREGRPGRTPIASIPELIVYE
jgi:hypothetical protein